MILKFNPQFYEVYNILDGEVILTLRNINFSGNNELILYLFSKPLEDILRLLPPLDRTKLLFANILILSNNYCYVGTAK